MIIMKFGGTSIGSAERIQGVAKIVSSERAKQPIVVVSAMSQVTNLLVELAASATSKRPTSTLESGIEQLRQIHRKTAVSLKLEPTATEALLKVIDAKVARLHEVLMSVSALGELTPRGSDLIASFGERLSIHLVAAALVKRGIPAEPVEASELIVTDDTFGNAQPNLELSQKNTLARLDPMLKNGITPVITGFIGATQNGVISTLGRGGSDYSATIIGHCAGAKEVWIWTDVDGVMTADPRHIKGAHTIAQLSYDEAAELSYFGAKVLHPRTIVPAAISNIPIFIKNTLNPTAFGTEITNVAVKHSDGAKAITALRALSLITIQGKGIQGMYGTAAKVFGALAETKINVLFISQASSENNITLVVNKGDGKRAVNALKAALGIELQAQKLEAVSEKSDLAMLAVVGEGMRNHTGVAGRIFTALGRGEINIVAIAQGSSERNISIIVSEEQSLKAIQYIHDELYLTGNHKMETA